MRTEPESWPMTYHMQASKLYIWGQVEIDVTLDRLLGAIHRRRHEGVGYDYDGWTTPAQEQGWCNAVNSTFYIELWMSGKGWRCYGGANAIIRHASIAAESLPKPPTCEHYGNTCWCRHL